MPDFTAIILLSVKIFAIVGTVLYVIFSLVVVKQVFMMTKNVTDKFNGVLKAFSLVHLLFSLFVVFLAATLL